MKTNEFFRVSGRFELMRSAKPRLQTRFSRRRVDLACSSHHRSRAARIVGRLDGTVRRAAGASQPSRSSTQNLAAVGFLRFPTGFDHYMPLMPPDDIWNPLCRLPVFRRCLTAVSVRLADRVGGEALPCAQCRGRPEMMFKTARELSDRAAGGSKTPDAPGIVRSFQGPSLGAQAPSSFPPKK